MTTLQMEIALMQYFNIRENLIVPCVTHMSGLVPFEIDLISVTTSGYATGVEIKISKSDLKNDINKKHLKNIPSGSSAKERWFKQYKYFYYAVPENLIDDALKQIPYFAGLIKVYQTKSSDGTYYHASEVRQPQHLYSTKWTDQMMYGLARLGTMRILSLKNKINNSIIPQWMGSNK